jgi:hypothetical protein
MWELFIHELIHLSQGEASKGKSWEGPETGSIEGEYSEEDYLSDRHEIQALAQDAVIEMLIYRESHTIKRYYRVFGPNHKVYKKFMKMVIKFSEEVGNA